MKPADRLGTIASDLKGGSSPPAVSVRQFLWWFGAQRRGYNKVWSIRSQLKKAGLVTKPDFESAYIDSHIAFVLADPLKPKTKGITPTSAEQILPPAAEPDPAKEAAQDPTYRVSKLAAANKAVIAVKPDATINEAVTMLMAGDFSQLPVMTSEREVKGVVSWKSIGERMGLGVTGKFVREFMDGHEEISSSASMFDAIPKIVSLDYVLVRADDKTISGIITSADLSVQFMTLSEPFLLLSEIENLIRSMIENKFTKEELRQACDSADSTREVDSVADMNFGEYIRLLENEDRWSKFNIAIDRAEFCRQLDQIRRIRNDVMHFDPDGVSDEDQKALRDFAKFVKRLTTIHPA